jgi:PPOX class probable F420-dependent enzyme
MRSQTWTPTGTVRAPTLAPFVRQRSVLLTTYRHDGTPKGTPIHIAVDGDHAYCRTWDTTWKLKRIRRNPNVTIAPSTARGVPTAPAIPARARILGGDEAAHAAHALAQKYPILHGILIPRFHRLRGYRTTHIELTPAV